VKFSALCYDKGVWQRVAVREGVRAVKHGRVFVKHVVPAIVKPAHTLWNEVIGFVFLCFAVPFGFKATRYAISGDFARFVPAAFCTVLMAYFCVRSFLKARKIARS
jgi:hypothetical protein